MSTFETTRNRNTNVISKSGGKYEKKQLIELNMVPLKGPIVRGEGDGGNA